MHRKIKIDAHGYWLILLALFVGMALVSCGPPPPPSIDSVMLATKVDSDYRPMGVTTTFKPTEQVNASVQVSNILVGNKVEARWYFGDDEIVEGRTLITADKAGSGYYAYMISSGSGFPVGDYKVEVYLDGRLLHTTRFKVVN